MRLLGDEQIATDVGLVFTATQALLAARAGSAYVSPSVGELDDAGQIGMDVVESIVRVFDNYGLETQICVQGIQNPIHVLDAAALGADVATLPVRRLGPALRASADGARRGVPEEPAVRRPEADPLISRARAVDLSHRMVERLSKTPGVALAGRARVPEEPHPSGGPRVGQGERAPLGRDGEEAPRRGRGASSRARASGTCSSPRRWSAPMPLSSPAANERGRDAVRSWLVSDCDGFDLGLGQGQHRAAWRGTRSTPLRPYASRSTGRSRTPSSATSAAAGISRASACRRRAISRARSR